MNGKNNITFLVIFFFCLRIMSGIAQETPKIEIDKLLQKELFNEHFSTVINQTAKSGIGSFASISTTSDIMNLGIYKQDDYGNIFSVEIKGGVSNGVLEILKGVDIIPNVEFKLELSVPYKEGKRSYLKYDNQLVAKAEEEYRKYLRKLEMTNIALTHKRDLHEAILESAKLKATYDKMETRIDNLMSTINKANVQDSIAILKANIDSCLVEQRQLDLEIEIMNSEEYWLSKENNALKLDLGKRKYWEDLIKKIPVYEAKRSWLYYQAKVGKRNFNQLKMELLNSKVIKEEFAEFEFAFGKKTLLSNMTKKSIKFVAFGISYTYGSNFNDLVKTSILEEVPITGLDNTSSVKNKTVYKGDFIDQKNGAKLFYDLYSTFGIGPLLFHYNADYYVRDDAKPNADMLFGMVIPFKSNDEKKSIINIEIFTKFSRILNREVNRDLIRDSTIGINTSFPFN